MRGSLVDSNVILDIFTNDSRWVGWSESILARYSTAASLYINAIIYSEISIGFERIEELESAMVKAGFKILDLPKEALFLAGKIFLQYKQRKGSKSAPLPDFFIGAQAAVLNLPLITRDINRYRSYFPTVRLITPDDNS